MRLSADALKLVKAKASADRISMTAAMDRMLLAPPVPELKVYRADEVHEIVTAAVRAAVAEQQPVKRIRAS